MSPHIYYNAIALFYQGAYGAIASAWEKYGDWKKAWDAVRHGARIDAEHEWRRLQERDVRLLLAADEAFPPHLLEIPVAPFGIYAKGSFQFNQPAIAIVGTRRATAEGKRIAEKCAEELASRGITIISGLALGIDGAAHRGALAACPEPGRRGTTIAVLPTGLDRIYPPHHANLADDIIQSHGTLISEYPFNTPSFPLHFLERNRIVSGLGVGTVVIEAPQKSGALVTARLAMEQNRDVFVVPGPVSHPNYQGSHRLIQQGASLITCAQDVCEHLNIPFNAPCAETGYANNPNLSPEERRVLHCLADAGTPLMIDTITELTTLELHVVNQTVASLTINGMIKETSGGYSL